MQVSCVTLMLRGILPDAMEGTMAKFKTAALTDLTVGLKLINEGNYVFKIAAVTTRIAVIQREDGTFVESVSHAFARKKYRVLLG